MNVKNMVGVAAGMAMAGIGLLKYVSDKYPPEYSEKWFDRMPDEELKVEREKVRQAYCSAGGDFSAGTRLQKLLWLFDDVLRKRDGNGSKEYVYPKHGENGWYLPGDD